MNFPDKALQEALDKKNPQRFPRFKKKGQGIDSCRYPQGFKLDGHRVFLPQRGWVRFINSREIEATPGNVTVSRRGDHWSVSLQTARQAEHFKRRDMSRPAPATSEAPGKKARARPRWNSVLLSDRGWFEFRRQPEDKPAWNGGWLLCVVPQNTSRTCPACARIVKENRKRQTRFRWLACGFGEHAEPVGAIESKRAGPARFAGAVSGAVLPPAAGIHQGNCPEAPAQA